MNPSTCYNRYSSPPNIKIFFGISSRTTMLVTAGSLDKTRMTVRHVSLFMTHDMIRDMTHGADMSWQGETGTGDACVMSPGREKK